MTDRISEDRKESDSYPAIIIRVVKSVFTLLAILLILTLCIIKLITFGYIGLLLLPFYLFVGVLHVIFHIRYLKTLRKVTLSNRAGMAISHLMLAAAFLLQHDPSNYASRIFISLIFGRLTGSLFQGWIWEEYTFEANISLFIPVAISWYLQRPFKIMRE